MNTDKLTTAAGAVAGLLIAGGAILSLFPRTATAGATLTGAGGALVAVLGKFAKGSDPDPESNGSTIPEK